MYYRASKSRKKASVLRTLYVGHASVNTAKLRGYLLELRRSSSLSAVVRNATVVFVCTVLFSALVLRPVVRGASVSSSLLLSLLMFITDIVKGPRACFGDQRLALSVSRPGVVKSNYR